MTAITGGLITLEYAAAGLHLPGVGSSAQADRDADLTAYVQAATGVIEDLVGPVLQTTKTIAVDGGVTSVVLPDRATSLVSVVVNGVTLPTSGYFLDTTGSILFAGSPMRPWAFQVGIRGVVITYQVGYPTVPATIQLAARELVRFWWQQGNAAQRSAYSDAVESTAPQGFAVPKRVIELCSPYIRPSVGFA